MDDKLTMEKLIAALAARLNMEQTDAEAFVCSFFTLIEDGLKKDKYVRIKGFGTFKLIDAEVNGGRIVFVPEVMVRDAINKPFAHFQPVELHDGVRFGDLEEVQVPLSDEASVSGDNAVNEIQAENETIEEKESMEKDGISHVDDCNCNPDDGNEVDEKGWFKSWYLLVAVLFTGIVIGGGIMWGLFSGKDDLEGSNVNFGNNKEVFVEQAPDSVNIKEDSDSLADEYVQHKDTAQVLKKNIDSVVNVTPVNKTEVEYLTEDVTYKISGSLGTYTIVKGSTLSKVANHYYGNKKLWPYIVMYNENVIDDPNNVPIGTVLRIPKLTPVD